MEYLDVSLVVHVVLIQRFKASYTQRARTLYKQLKNRHIKNSIRFYSLSSYITIITYNMKPLYTIVSLIINTQKLKLNSLKIKCNFLQI